MIKMKQKSERHKRKSKHHKKEKEYVNCLN